MRNLIEEFYNVEGKDYDISLEECKLVCTSPFKFVKEILNRGLLKDIRLKYFGVFEVSSSRVKYFKKTLEKNYNKGLVSEKKYNEKKEILDRYES